MPVDWNNRVDRITVNPDDIKAHKSAWDEMFKDAVEKLRDAELYAETRLAEPLPDFVSTPITPAAERIAMKFIAADPCAPQWGEVQEEDRDQLIRIINTLIHEEVIVPGPNQ